MTSGRFDRWSLKPPLSVEEAGERLLAALSVARETLEGTGQTAVASAMKKFENLHRMECPDTTGELLPILGDLQPCAIPLFSSAARLLTLLETTGWLVRDRRRHDETRGSALGGRERSFRSGGRSRIRSRYLGLIPWYPEAMFLDEAIVTFTSGKGGSGAVAFHKEKHVPRGGPNGSDGGRGVTSPLIADRNRRTLYDFKLLDHYEAVDGGHAHGNKRGRDGKGITVKVPVGTLITDEETGDLLVDMTVHERSTRSARAVREGSGTPTTFRASGRCPTSPRRALRRSASASAWNSSSSRISVW